MPPAQPAQQATAQRNLSPYDRPTQSGSGSGSGSAKSKSKSSSSSKSTQTVPPVPPVPPAPQQQASQGGAESSQRGAKESAPITKTDGLSVPPSDGQKPGRMRRRRGNRSCTNTSDVSVSVSNPTPKLSDSKQANPASVPSPVGVASSSVPLPAGSSRGEIMRSLMNVQAPSSPLAVSTLANQAPASALIKEDKPDRKVAKLKSKVKDLENAKEKEARRAADALKKVEELEKELERHKAEIKAKSEALDRHEQAGEALREAVSCGVCMDTLNDPHILSCGHIACKDCLRMWFRTPGAYLHDPRGSQATPTIPSDLDLSYHSKSCHVCRAVILRRPTRMFHLGGILEPLGIDPKLPSASQQTADDDPWALTFPAERSTYRIWDENEHLHRCPECGGEVVDGSCCACGNDFSENENEGSEGVIWEGDWRSDDGSGMGDDESIEEEHLEGAEDAAGGRRRAGRGFRFNIFDLEAVSDGDGSDPSLSGSDEEMPADRRRRHRRENQDRLPERDRLIPDAVRNVLDAIDARSDGSSGSYDEDYEGSEIPSFHPSDYDGDSDLDTHDDLVEGDGVHWPIGRRGHGAIVPVLAASARDQRRTRTARRYQSEDVEMSVDDDQSQYEGSFIDDSDLDGTDYAEEDERVMDEAGDADEDEVQADEPTMDELRRRRVRALEANSNTGRRTIATSPEIVRRAPRRNNAIILSDDESD